MSKKNNPVTLDPFQSWCHRWGRIGTIIALVDNGCIRPIKFRALRHNDYGSWRYYTTVEQSWQVVFAADI